MTVFYGHDVSTYQVGTYTVHDALSKGYRFLIAKASQGPDRWRTSFEDGGYAHFVRQQHGTRMLFGAYHFLTRDKGMPPTGAAQAQYFASIIGAVKWAAVDVEALSLHCKRGEHFDPATRSCVKGPGNRTYVQSHPKAIDVIQFVTEFRRIRPQTRLKVYSSLGYWSAIGNPDVHALGAEIWPADWGPDSKPDDADPRWHSIHWGGFHGTNIMQWGHDHTNQMHGMDGDAFRGTEQELLAEFSSGSTGGGGECPAGYHRDANDVCVPNTDPCPVGQHLDPSSGVCVPDSDPGNPFIDPVTGGISTGGVAAAGIGGGIGLLLGGAIVAAVSVVVLLAVKGHKKGESILPHLQEGYDGA